MFATSFHIEDRKVGAGQPCLVIAEAGVSHFGDIEKAYALVDAAAAAGADAVKFQIFDTTEMIRASNREWVERMRPKELPIEAFSRIQAHCRTKGIVFFATAHDSKSLAALSSLDPPVYKIGSGEVQNTEFFKSVARLGKPIIFSTGMYQPGDLENSLNALRSEKCFNAAVLHCITKYPTPPDEVNLRRIQTLHQVFEGPVGYSDHCATHDIAAAAVLYGARIIEKHITLEKNIPNAQDWKVACDPTELSEFVKSIRRLEAAIGTPELGTGQTDLDQTRWARKSIVASRFIPAGTILTAADICFKRPGDGLSPAQIQKIIGRTAAVDIEADVRIEWEQFEKRNKD